MDIETLERSINELNEIELAYRDGTQREWYFPPHLLTHEDGRLRIKKSIFIDFTGGSGIGRGRIPMTNDQLLFMFRVLRFEPAPEHVHDFVEISYVYRGTCVERVNGVDLTIHEGQTLLLEPDCPHRIYPLGEDDIVISIGVEKHLLKESLEALRQPDDWLTSFLLDLMDEQADHNHHIVFLTEERRRFRSLIQEFMCEYIDPSPNAGRMLSGMFQLLLVDLFNVFREDVDHAEQESTVRRVSAIPIIGYIQEHYLECSLESVAEQFFVSPNYISRVLKKSVGKTYRQLVQELRLSHAARLIEIGGYSAEEAAHTAGFTNMSFFYRKFKETYGLTPAAYREQATV